MWLHCLHQHWHQKQPNDGLVTLRKQILLIFSPDGYLATDKHLGHESKRGRGDSDQKCFFPSAAISSSQHSGGGRTVPKCMGPRAARRLG